MSGASRATVLVGGGVRSGKSRFAVARALELGERRVFVATAQAGDAEMRDRIARHRKERGSTFRTVEEAFEVPELLMQVDDADVVLVDCITLWLSNLLVDGRSEASIERSVGELVDALGHCSAHVVLVTNEVGMGIVPESSMGRAFRDIAGLAHQRLAAASSEIYLAALGTVLRLRPSPLGLVHPAGPDDSVRAV